DQTTAPFIEKRGHRRKPLPDGFDIDHHYNIWYPNQVVNPYITLSKVDSIISGRALSISALYLDIGIIRSYGIGVADCSLNVAEVAPAAARSWRTHLDNLPWSCEPWRRRRDIGGRHCRQRHRRNLSPAR